MNPIAKIIGVLVLFGGGAYGISKLAQTSRTGKKTSVTIAGVDPPKLKNGSVILSINIAFDNPTERDLSLKKPYIKAFYNGKEVGNSIPSQERTTIIKNDRTTIKGITLQIPFTKLSSIAWDLLSNSTPAMEFDIEVSTEANGIPYTDKQHFKL